MGPELTIDGVEINDESPCYVIAEIGNNHQGDVAVCKEMFKVCKERGANAVKLQKRDNKTLFTQEMYDSPYVNHNAFGDTYGEHREFLEFGMDEYKELQDYANEIGITFFATAFDIKSADFLAELDMPAYKLASGDLTSAPLLKHVASIGKPMVISTGGASMYDIHRAYDTIKPLNDQLCIMQCTAGYPPEWEELNLRVIETFRKEFPDTVIGFSSHDSGIAMGPVGYILGARVIEKHFTLNRANKGTDHAFSLEPPGLRRLVRDLERTHRSLGDGKKKRYDSEIKPLYKMGKKLVAARAISAGEILKPEDITLRSPNDGTPPYRFEEFIGRKLIKDLPLEANLMLSDTVGADEEV